MDGADATAAALSTSALRDALDDARRHLDVLDEITRALAPAITPTQVAEAILDSCVAALGATTGTLAVVEAGSLRLAGLTGLPGGVPREWQSFPVDVSTPLGETALLGLPVFIETTEERDRRYPGLREIREMTGSGPVAAIPLHLGGEVIAALAFTFPGDSRTFTRSERSFMGGVGFHCAAALARARLLDHEQRASKSLESALERISWLQVLAAALSAAGDERAIIDAMTEHGLEALAARAVAAVEPTSEPDSPTVILRTGWPEEAVSASDAVFSQLAGRVVYTGEQVQLASLEDAAQDRELELLHQDFGRSGLVVVPYHSPGRSAGALVVVLDGPGSFTPELQGLRTAVAELFGQALARARSFDSVLETEERLRAVVETAVDGIVVIDERGAIEAANPAMERIFGYSRDEMEGRSISTLMSDADADHHDGSLVGYLTGARPARVIGIGREVTGRRKDGSKFPLELSVSETILPGRVAFTGILRDISDRKQAEAALQAARDTAAEASRVKGRFLTSVSHELRNPLNAILGFAQLLLDGLYRPLGDEQADAIRRIRRSGRNLLQLIEEVLFYTALEGPPRSAGLAPISVGAVVRETAALVRPGAEQKGVKVAVRHPDDPVRIETQDTRIRQILLHLFGGAVKLTGEGTITAGIEVSDTGVAVRIHCPGLTLSAADLDSIWEPFRKVGGTRDAMHDFSLGLPIAVRLARAIGADISVSSDDEHGTTFSLEIPQG